MANQKATNADIKYLDEVIIIRQGKQHKITKMPLWLRIKLIFQPVWRIESGLLTCRYQEYKNKLYWIALQINNEE